MEKRCKLYIVLTRSGSPISSAMQKLNLGYYTHACISFDRELKRMYSFGALFPLDPFHTGLKKESVYDPFYVAKPSVPVKILELPVTKEQYCKACKVVHYLIKYHNDFSFNTVGMIYNVLRISKPSKNKLFCSEFVYTLLREIDVVNFMKPTHFVLPDDFLKIDKVKTVFEGKIELLQNQLSDLYGTVSEQIKDKHKK